MNGTFTTRGTGTLHRDPKTGRWYVFTRDAGRVDLSDALQSKPDASTCEGADVEITIEGSRLACIVTAYNFI